MAERKSTAVLGREGLAEALGFHEDYHAARGAHLLTAQRRVLDLTGGGGALLRGHNPTDLIDTARRSFDDDLPRALSATSSPSSRELRRRLADCARAATGRPYQVTLATSENEAFEQALLHVQLERRRAIREIERDRRRNLVHVRRRLRRREIRPSSTFLRDVATALRIDTVHTFDDAVFELIRHAKEVGRRPGTIIAVAHAYHGRSTGALAVSYDARERTAFAHGSHRCEFIDGDDVTRLHERMRRNIDVWFDIEIDDDGRIGVVARPFVNVAAIVVEPLLMEGAVMPLSADFLRELRQAADTVGCPLIVDETRSGLGWTGRFLASDNSGIAADYYVIGSILGGGVASMGALLVHEPRYVQSSPRTPSPAGAGGETACRVALTQLAALTESEGVLSADITAETTRINGSLHTILDGLIADHPTIFRSWRGEGLLLGLTLAPLFSSSSPGIRMLAEQNLIGPAVAAYLLHEENIRLLPCTGAPATLRIVCPLAVRSRDLRKLDKSLRRAARILERGDFAGLVRHLVGLVGQPRSRRVWGTVPVEIDEPSYAKKVAFVGHHISAATMPHWEPSLIQIPIERRDELGLKLQRFLEPTLSLRRTVRSATGEIVTLHFLGLTITSKTIIDSMAQRNTAWILRLIDEAIERAVELGCTVVGFGGFTALLTRNCRDVVDDRIATTSGISFTVVAGFEAMVATARSLGIEPETTAAGVVGAWTDLCRNYAAVLAETVPRIILVGPASRHGRLEETASEILFQALKTLHDDRVTNRSDDLPPTASGVAAILGATATGRRHLARPLPPRGSPRTLGPTLLQELRAELGDSIDSPMPVVITDDQTALRSCQLIVAGAPRGQATIDLEHLGDHPSVICDIALPPSVSSRVADGRPDVALLLGGLVRLPSAPDFVVPGIPLPAGASFGCMAETMLLGLTGIMEDYSVGQLTQLKIRKIKELASLHGFELGLDKTIASM